MPKANSTKIERVCLFCGKTFLKESWRTRREACNFCSPRCGHSHRVVPLIDRFFRYVGRKQPNGCILWTGQTNIHGYGLIFSLAHKRKIQASRISYELFVGPIPEGLFVCHRCDTPACVNPVHLFLGTQDDNMADMNSKGRHCKGEKVLSSKLSKKLVLQIRKRYTEERIKMADLGKEYGVSKASISRVIRGDSWKHV